MATPLQSQPPKRRAPKLDDAGTRALNAMLRWRLRWTLARLPVDQAQALRFLPALLQASFASQPLRGEAPGVARLKFRRRWSTLARLFGLPPPSSMQRAKPAIEAIFLVPRGETLDVIALVASDLPQAMRARVNERITAAKAALGAAGRAIELRLTGLTAVDEAEFQQIISLGSLLAGAPPPVFYSGVHQGAPSTLPIAASLAERAPSPMAALALMLLVGAPTASPLEVARKAAEEKTRARKLADPSFFAARWAAMATGREQLLMTALRWSDAKPKPGEEVSPRELLEAGRELTLRCAQAVRRLPLSASKGLRSRLRREVIGQGIPRALLPALGRCKLRLSPAPIPVGNVFEVRNSDGAVLGRGRTGTQARVRALALATASGTPPENKLAQRLAKGATAPTSHLVVETYEVPGPPFDPLNRGPGRQIGIVSSTALLLQPDARPSAFQLNADETVLFVTNNALQSRELEIVSQTAEGQPAAARLSRVVALLQKKGSLPPAIEAGGAVLSPKLNRMRRVALRQFARRPIACSVDPEAFDLSLSPERGARNTGTFAIPGAVAARVFQSDGDPLVACVLTQDDRGRLLREEVPIDRVEDHLREGQEILRGCVPPAPLASRLSEGMEMVLLRHRRQLFQLGVVIGGELPFKLWVEVSGERFQLANPGGWAAAAQAILSWLPIGEEPRLRIVKCDITERGEPACAIARLYVRSLVIRRLAVHLKKQLSLIDR